MPHHLFILSSRVFRLIDFSMNIVLFEKKKRVLTLLICWAIISFSLIIFIATFYKSEIVQKGVYRDIYLPFYGLSAVLILVGFLALKSKLITRLKLILSLAVLGVGLIGVETLYGYWIDTKPRRDSSKKISEAKRIGIEYDKRSTLEIISDYSRDGIDAVPMYQQNHGHFPFEVGDILPLAGVSGKTTIGKNESGKFLIYTSDRFGFNNPDKQWDSEIFE